MNTVIKQKNWIKCNEIFKEIPEPWLSDPDPSIAEWVFFAYSLNVSSYINLGKFESAKGFQEAYFSYLFLNPPKIFGWGLAPVWGV